MKYLKVFTDFIGNLEPLSDAERGRLFTAMLEYAESGVEPELRGGERYVWYTAKSGIDRQSESYQNKVEGMAKARKIGADIRANLKQSNRLTQISKQDNDKDNDNDNEDLITSSGEDVCPTGVGRGDIKTIIAAWNSLNLNPIRDIKPNTTRRQLLNGRLSNYSLSDVLQAIENVRCSEFLNGQNKNGWTATFDWFVKPTNFQKVLDGNYDNRRSPAATSTADRLSQMIEDGVFND